MDTAPVHYANGPLTSHAIQDAVDGAYAAALKVHDGVGASYIPYLAKIPNELCGVCAVTPAGERFEAGDTRFPFAIESISKLFTMALVMEQLGSEFVRAKIGARPTGFPFNSVLALELNKDQPLSPLVNAGAIAAASQIRATGREDRWAQILNMQRLFAGTAIEMASELNQSEQSTNFHNRAIAWLLASAGHIGCDAMEALDVYTRQCSTLISCVDLAVMGATLANGGVNPFTRKTVIRRPIVPAILAEMTMEGLYESSGDWAFEVGLPGKSGVGGGILAVAPGRLSISAFAPPLDTAGNSVRGQVAVKAVVNRLGLNIYEARE
jgi:glutaminase